MGNNNCLERTEMKRYLHGWTDEAASIEFEKHLSVCPDCEQTLSLVDAETQTADLPGLLAPSLGDEVSSGDESPSSNAAAEFPTELPDELRAAVDEIRGWNHEVIGANGSVAAVKLISPTGDFGNYELLELVGKGGMAEVYRARHKRLQRDVALKMIRVPRWHMAESLSRIEREMQAVGRLNHPAIVNAVDAGDHGGIQFLVTEFIDGLDVGRIARASSPLPIGDACELVRVAALGLDHAHANGIIHRDIKPSNLMIDRRGQVKILDFGLVHMDGWTGVSAEVTSVGQLLGTLDYMAPEQADRADHVSPRSDVYSLGATLFRLLCGRAPYAACSNQSPLEKLRLLANERPPRIATLRPDLAKPLADLIDRTLARNPGERPPSAAHLAEALQPFCDGADLIGLLERAIRVPNESLGSPENAESFAPSLVSLVANTDKPRKQTRRSGRSRRIWQPLVGLAMLFGAAWLGIVLVLETQKGQVVIETDVPNLQVELLAAGEVKQEIELVPGENTTRVYAGEYEIRIKEGTDRYVIDQSSFVLKRGEKIVARITVSPNDKQAAITWSNGHATIPPNPAGITNADTQTNQDPVSDSPSVIPDLNSFFGDSPVLQVYSVSGDVEQYHRILSTLLDGETKVRVEAEPAARKLIVWAPRSVHDMISQTLEELDGVAPADPVTDSQPTLNQPVFDGKTLDEWLNVLEFETNDTLVHSAKTAIAALSKGHLKTKQRVDQFLMKHIMTGQGADWVERAVATLGLSDDSMDQIAATLPGKDNEVSRWRIEILLANLAAYQSEAEFEARLNRIRSALSKLDPSMRLFDSNNDSSRLYQRIRIMFDRFSRNPASIPKNKSLLNAHSRMLSDLMSSPNIGPRLVLSLGVVRVLNGINPLKPLLYSAATSAIRQYGIDDPDFHFWTAVIIAMGDVATPEMKAQLADVLDEQLLAISNSPQSISRWSVYNHGDLIRYTNFSSSELSFLQQLTRFTIGRYRAVLRGDSVDRPASKVIEMLVMRSNLRLPLNVNGQAAVEAIRKATADRAEEFEQLLTEATRTAIDEADQSLPKQFVLEFSREDKSLVQVYFDWDQQSRELGGRAVGGIGGGGGIGGLGGLGSGGPGVVRERMLTVNAEVAMSTLLHEQTTIMLELESDKK